MDPSFEETETDVCIAENVEKFHKFKKLRNARMLTTEISPKTGKPADLYYCAMDKMWVQLTLLGRLYWNLAKNDQI